MGKQRLNRLKGKKAVLTTDANLISPSEVGIIEISNGKVQVKTHVNGVLQNIAAGESTKINNQDKTINIDSNGIFEVTADAGYTGLGKVQINTNVAGSGTSAPEYIGFRLFSGGMGDGFEYEFSTWNETGTWQDAVNESRYHLIYQFSEQDGNVYVTHGDNSYMIYKTMEDNAWNPSYSDPVKVTDKLESTVYYIDTYLQGM